ncbi:hypothetical protein Tco_0614067 [Tanacetum coccineum]
MFDRAFQRVNTFEDFRTELVEGKEKRAREELIQETSKKQKVDDDTETAELKQCLEIIPDEEEVTIDAIPLVVKEDLEDLYKLIKARYGSTRPVESMDYLLWNDMKIMFDPHVEDEVWKLQQGYKMLEWKLYDSCGGRIVGIKSLLDAVGITAAQVYVNTALMNLVARPPYYLEKDFMKDHLPGELEIAREADLNPFKDVLVFRKMVEFLGAVPISLNENMWESEDLIEKKID